MDRFPCLIHPTYVGHHLYSTPDIVEEHLNHTIGQVNVHETINRDYGNMPMNQLIKSSKSISSKCIWSTRGHGEDQVANGKQTSLYHYSKDGKEIETQFGRKKMSLNEILERIKIDQPYGYISMAEEVNNGKPFNSKQLKRAFERSNDWLKKSLAFRNENQLNLKIYGVNIMNFSSEENVDPKVVNYFIKNLTFMLESGVDGVIVGGAFTGESESSRINNIQQIRKVIDPSIPILIQGASSIRDILICIQNGIDMVSTDCAVQLTKKGYALFLTLKPSSNLNEIKSNQNELENLNTKRNFSSSGIVDNELDVKRSEKKGKLSDDAIAPQTQNNFEMDEKCTINLWDNKFTKDISPMVENCECHSCIHHTRAYIHHLLLCKEMLSEILLYKHNQHQLCQLMFYIRNQLANGLSIVEIVNKLLEDNVSLK